MAPICSSANRSSRRRSKRGEKKPEVEKPKRASVPKGVSPDEIDLEKALGLLALPREVGLSPEDGEPIIAGVGRFGPYVKHGKIYANLEDGDDVLTIGLNRAVTLIAEKKANPKKGRRFGADPGQGSGRTSRQRRPGCRQERALWPLRQPQWRQRHHYRRQDAGDNHADRGGRSARRPCRPTEFAAAPRSRPQEGGRAVGSPERPQEKGRRASWTPDRESGQAAQESRRKRPAKVTAAE